MGGEKEETDEPRLRTDRRSVAAELLRSAQWFVTAVLQDWWIIYEFVINLDDLAD